MVSISGITKLAKYSYKGGIALLKATPELLCGSSAEKVGTALKSAYKSGKSINQTARIFYKEVERAGNTNFLKKTWKNLTHLVPDLKNYTKAGVRLAQRNAAIAKATGTSVKNTNALVVGAKGLLKGIGKKLPFIFAISILFGQVPSIVQATKEQGIFSGLKETGKTVAKLAFAAIGSVLGSAICPGIGTMAGWFISEWLANRIVGKSYSEQKAEQEEKLAQLQQNNQIPQQQIQNLNQPKENDIPNNIQTTTNPIQTPLNTQTTDNQVQDQNSTNVAQRSYIPSPQSVFAQNGFNTIPYPNFNQANDYSNDLMMKNLNFSKIA